MKGKVVISSRSFSSGNIDLIKYLKENRIGDHIWYISDVSKFKEHYPKWDFKYNIDDILNQICEKGHF